MADAYKESKAKSEAFKVNAEDQKKKEPESANEPSK